MPQQRKTLSVQEKRSILDKVDGYVGSRVSLARNLGIPITTLATIIKNRKSIEKSAIQYGIRAKKRMYIKTSKYKEIEEILKEWFVIAQSSNLPINGPIIREKALHIATRLNIRGFTASNGWIDRFKKRHFEVYTSICGGSKSVDLEIAKNWKQTDVPTLIADYAPKDIFNADETGLFYNVLPWKTFNFKEEACHDGKLSKLRLTVLMITNSDGSEKLPPLVIGNRQNPRCFKNVKSLPTTYAANKKAWMTSKLFEKQLISLDAMMEAKKRKIILFLDRCPAHPINLILRNIQLAFFPANCISEVQPLVLGIIHTFKYCYRKNLIQMILSKIKQGKDPQNFKVSVLDAMHYIVKAWSEVKKNTISNCFQKAGIYKVEIEENEIGNTTEHIIDGWERLSSEPLQNYINIDSNVMTSDVLEIDDIVNSHIPENLPDEELSDEKLSDEEELNSNLIPTKEDAMRYIEGLKRYFSSIDNVQEETFKSIYDIEKVLYV